MTGLETSTRRVADASEQVVKCVRRPVRRPPTSERTRSTESDGSFGGSRVHRAGSDVRGLQTLLAKAWCADACTEKCSGDGVTPPLELPAAMKPR